MSHETQKSGFRKIGQCKIIHKTQSDADQCCDWKCSKCGAKTDRFSTQCSSCWDVVRAEGRAKRLAAAELVTEYDGWICCDSGCGSQDGYFQSIEDYVDYIAREILSQTSAGSGQSSCFAALRKSKPLISGAYLKTYVLMGTRTWKNI